MTYRPTTRPTAALSPCAVRRPGWFARSKRYEYDGYMDPHGHKFLRVTCTKPRTEARADGKWARGITRPGLNHGQVAWYEVAA